MLDTSNKQPIKIAILEASAQNVAVLEYFFTNAGKSLFKQTNLEYADAYIIDYDFPNAKENLEALIQKANKPTILISMKETELPYAIWIAKPLTSVALIDASKQIKDLLHENISAPDTVIATKETSIEVKSKEVTVSETHTKKAKTKESQKENSKAELAVAGADTNDELTFDALSHSSDVMNSEEELLVKTDDKDVNEDNLKLENVDFEDLTIKKTRVENTKTESLDVVDMIEFDSLSSNKQTTDTSTSAENISLETFEADSNNTELTLKLEADSDNNIKAKLSDAEVPVLDDDSIKNETNESLKGSSTKAEISTVGDFAISPTLINVDHNIQSNDEAANNPAPETSNEESLPEKVLLDADISPSTEEDMDTLLETLISGGKIKKVTQATTSNALLDTANLLENIDKDQVPSANSLELEIIDDSELIDDASLQSVASQPLIQDDATSVLLDDYEFSSEELNESDNIIADTIGEEIYIEPAAPEAQSSKKEVVYNKKSAEEELQSLLDELKEEAESSETSHSPKQKSPAFSSDNSTTAEARWNLTCGSLIDDEIIDNEEQETKDKPKKKDSDSYTLTNHMLSTFLDVLEQSRYTKKVMRLKFKGHIIVVDHSTDFIFCDNSIFSESYAQVCYDTINEVDIKIHELDKSEVRLYNTKRVEEPKNSHSIDAFIWTTSLLTARGRLLKYTDMSKKVGLKYWPNLTRLEQFPHAMQIAAVFYKHPGSLTEVSEWLNIDQRFIFAFYNAALSLKLIELDSKKIKSSSSDLKKTSKKNRGFFSRLLKRITS